MKIKVLRLKISACFTWLKYVNAVNLSEHCAKSLVGTYEKRWKRFGSPYILDLELPESPFYYFCAVTKSYDTNVHVAFVRSEGNTMIVDTPLVYMVVEDAAQIEITDEFIDWSLPQSKDKAFHTCRNWWFASMLSKTGLVQNVTN